MPFVAFPVSFSCGQCVKLHKITTYMWSAQLYVESLGMPVPKILTGLDGRKATQENNSFRLAV